MAFEIKPEDFITGEKKENSESFNTKSYLKNFVETAKLAKAGANEALGFFGMTPDDVKSVIQNKFSGRSQAPPVPQISYNSQPTPTPQKQIEQPKTDKMDKFDIEKAIKKMKLIVKFLHAEDKKVSEFLEEIEDNKEDIKELME